MVCMIGDADTCACTPNCLHSAICPPVNQSGVNVAILVGGSPRKAGMQRADLMEKNAPIFVKQGEALEKYADRNVKAWKLILW